MRFNSVKIRGLPVFYLFIFLLTFCFEHTLTCITIYGYKVANSKAIQNEKYLFYLKF